MSTTTIKRCSKCDEEKPEFEFALHGSAKGGRRAYCKPCGVRAAQAYKRRNPRAGRAWWIKHAYGITLEEYDALMERQQKRCAICRTEFAPEGCSPQEAQGRQACVDHDHKTKTVRGLLCFHCNTVLGKVHDDPDVLRAAAAYLEESR